MMSARTSSERGGPRAPACSIVREGFTIHPVAGSGLEHGSCGMLAFPQQLHRDLGGSIQRSMRLRTGWEPVGQPVGQREQAPRRRIWSLS
jgi:hypothetical protein